MKADTLKKAMRLLEPDWGMIISYIIGMVMGLFIGYSEGIYEGCP